MSDRESMKAPIPENVHFDRTPDGFTLTYRWPRRTGALMLGGAILPPAFLYLFFVKEGLLDSLPRWWLFVFAAGCVTNTYAAIARLLNRTRVELGDGTLAVRHGPVPWSGGRSLKTVRIKRLYIGYPVLQFSIGRGNAARPELRAVLREGDEVRLLAAPADVLILVREETLARLGLASDDPAGSMPSGSGGGPP